MTLTLLLQLTDDEQLYAQTPAVPEVKVEEEPPAPAEAEETTAPWPIELDPIG